MATVTPTFARVSDGDGSIVQLQWALTTADADGAPFEFTEWADITVVATGTWGGATLKVQGSANGTTFPATGLSNAAGGTEATAAADKVFPTIERPRYMRPILTTAGTGATVTVTAILRRSNPLRT